MSSSQASRAISILPLVLMLFLASSALRGSKVLVALGALELGANAFTVGLLAALYAVFPIIFAVYAGRISDTLGVSRPILGGTLGMTAALLLPAIDVNIVTLIICPALIGLGHIFFAISLHNAVGLLSTAEGRTRNFSTLSLGASLAAFVGPILVGATIDNLGHRAGFALMAVLTAAVLIPLFLSDRRFDVGGKPTEEKAPQRTADLLAVPGLRRTLFMSGAALTAIELFSFYIPIYGQSIGLSATVIGSLLAAFGAAAFIVRLFINKILQRFSEIAVLTASLFIAALGYALVPILGDVALLIAISFLLGLGLGAAQPLTLMLTYNNAPEGRSGEALGLRQIVNKAMQIGVPIIFGGIGTVFGVAPVFWANAAFLLGGGLLSTLDMLRRAKRRK